MKKLLKFLNPVEHLGENNYTPGFPLIANILLIVFSEIYSFLIAGDSMTVGSYIIFFNVAFIIYFAFREGIRGGIISAASAIIYYFYIVNSRHYTGQQLTSGISMIVMLGILYFLLGTTIGWLKQKIDKLIEFETDAKIRLETILQQLPVGIFITDKYGTLTNKNKLFDEILGVKLSLGFNIKKDAMKNVKLNDIKYSPNQNPLLKSIQTGKPIIDQEFLYEGPDGKKITILVSATTIHNKKRKVIAAASIINDITKLKELERQKDEFIGIASHELRTPVTSIKAYGQALKSQFSKKGDLKVVGLLEKMDSQINKLTNLIGDLLDVTKIQSGRLEFNREYFDFNKMVSEVVDEIQFTSNSHKLQKRFGESEKIYSDRERIGQVLTNLITNAIKYSPNSKKILVTTKTNNSLVTLSVQDFGVGIPKSKQNKVFEQFFRVSGPNKNTYPGLGLGLYISSQIIKREGGRIWVESVVGKGSKFYFSLPIKKPKKL